jgi:hypothetical protein
MPLRYLFAITAVSLALSLPIAVSAQAPVKWSAPIHEYPNPWQPTQAPPQHSAWGGGYQPFNNYGYGQWGAPYQAGHSGGQANHYPGQYPGYYSGFSGNPYQYFYGQ